LQPVVQLRIASTLHRVCGGDFAVVPSVDDGES
jgi:hypothetical protein